MAEIVADCPRCRAQKTTFDVSYSHVVGTQYRWQQIVEIQAVCRHCNRGVIFIATQKGADDRTSQAVRDGVQKLKGNLNEIVEVERFVSIRDTLPITPPEHLPPEIDSAFREGASCAAIGCHNAAAAMFRLCVDHATYALLPEDGVEGLNAMIKRSLGLRLKWLLDTKRLPEALRDLSEAIKEDGNDGAHEGTLTKAESEDLQDFTVALLERLYTEPSRLQLAKERRDARRAAPSE